MADFVEAVTSEGRRVLEAEAADAGDAGEWIALARSRGAELLWLHSGADLAPLGFASFPGYVRLRADDSPTGNVRLPRLLTPDYAGTLDRAYRGLWGHKEVAPDAEPPPGAVVLGLYERDEPLGLCTIFPADRLVDGPGVIAQARRPAAYGSLLRAACAELGPGPVDLDSWGDDPAVIAAYLDLGFEIVERAGGWQLEVR